jgi:Ion channel
MIPTMAMDHMAEDGEEEDDQFQDELEGYDEGSLMIPDEQDIRRLYESDEQDIRHLYDNEEGEEYRKRQSDDDNLPLEDVKSDTASSRVKSVRFDADSFRDWDTRLLDDDNVVDAVDTSPRRRRQSIMVLLGQSPVHEERRRQNPHYSITRTSIAAQRRSSSSFQNAVASVMSPPLAEPPPSPLPASAAKNGWARLRYVVSTSLSERSTRSQGDNIETVSVVHTVHDPTRDFGCGDIGDSDAMEIGPKHAHAHTEPEYRLKSKQSANFFADDQSYNPRSYVAYYLRWAFQASFPGVILSAYVCFLVLVISFALAIYGIGRLQPECFVMTNGDDYGESGKTFVDAFSLSWTTFSTCGYGAIFPRVGKDQDNPGSGQCMAVNMVSVAFS